MFEISPSIFIGTGIKHEIALKINQVKNVSTVVLFSDTRVFKLHSFSNPIKSARFLVFLLPPGEESKSRAVKAELEDWLLSNSVGRDSLFIALGGGVVGDLVGFVASTFMRGVPVIQIPTTLLAMVDSSIGGKTAIDTPNGKNLIGTFHLPMFVFIDTIYLQTLDKRQFFNGMAEIVKTCAFGSSKDFNFLEDNTKSIVSFAEGNINTETSSIMMEIILKSAKTKSDIVTLDQKESGLRGLLNFGHTIGHAIEAILTPHILHGECVSIGIVKEAEISNFLGHLTGSCVGRLITCLKTFNLPVSLEDSLITRHTKKHCSVDSMLNFMKIDKKNQGDKKKIVLLTDIGKTLEQQASIVDDSIIRKILSPNVQVYPLIPKSKISLAVPGSKSISNRALLMAALGSGSCRLHGLLHSDDVQVMLIALEKLLEIKYEWDNETLIINGGNGNLVGQVSSEIYLGNAGTAARFLTSVCSLKGTSILTGNARMKQRPIGPLVDALKSNGIDIEYQESIGCLPLKIKSSGLSGGIINLDSKISSQYVSSILISSPYAKTPVTLNLIGDSIVSQPYIDMTISMMIKFGAKVSKIPNANSYLIQNTGYINPTDYFIEGDASSATYPLAIAAVTKSTIEVTNIGSGSIQGDSEFAIKVLKEMGCIVSQTESSTTVTGPAQLTNIPLIDMESMTDAFLTAAVVASFAVTGTSTKITGISNQRVKECNRISAMINELSKFNVKALEMDDGIEVFGCDDIVYSKPVECYDDHRVAMSFSVLGSGLKSGSTVITDKKCTAKTWPGWWNCLENNIGATIEGVDEVEHHSAVSLKPIILIGMRGVGKTTFGKIIAKHLDRKFIDMDSFMESELSSTIPDIITTNGWDSFRLLELEMLKKVLNENSGNIIISTGGGIIELEASQDFLSLLKRNRKADILHLFQPNFSIIKTSLDADKSRPLLLKDLESIWNRRKPIYQSICNYEFVFIDQDFKRLESDLLNLVDFIVYPILIISKQSYFISLTYPNLSNIDLDVFMDVITGIDLIELRVDLLESTDTDFIALSVFQLKRLISTTGYKIPILFTVRSSSQGGNFTESIFPLVKKAFKWACEYIDIEIDGYKISREFIEVIENKGNCFIIGSFHDIKSKFQWKESIKIENSNDTFILEQGLSMKNVYNLLEPHVDIVKLIGTSRSISDSFDITSFAATNCMKPLIAINMGETGKLSRVLNSYLTPITHEKLSLKAAPGQLTLEEINNLKFLMGMQESKKFYLFGAPISESKSPLLHSTGFKKVGLKYTYDLFETDNVKEIEDFVMNNRVDGASVTIPLKQEILKSVLITSCSKAVKIINAANTITKTLNDGYFADNTDYLGIKKSFEKFELSGDLVGVVIGAGGTARAACLALFELNCTVVKVYNRGKERCQELVNEFNSKLGNIFVACEMEDLIKEDGFHLVVSTIPGNAQDEKLVNIMIGEKDIKGVLVEMAMKPRETWMIRKWKGDKVYGLDVLIEQGIEQWRRFTGISVVPENEMKKVC